MGIINDLADFVLRNCYLLVGTHLCILETSLSDFLVWESQIGAFSYPHFRLIYWRYLRLDVGRIV